MSQPDVTLLGDYIDPDGYNFEGTLSFSVKAAYIEKRTIWKSKDLAAEFLGDFWQNMLKNDDIKATLHFVCGELMENAVNHSLTNDYMIRIQLCFREKELMVYVKNSADPESADNLKAFCRTLLEAENLQKLFIKKMKAAKKNKSKKSQLGLITILKDRGAKLSWKLETKPGAMEVTTLARIFIKKDDE